MTAPRVGETFHLDLHGTTIAGRYIEVDPPHRMLLRWDRQGTDTATPTPTFIEITLTPTSDGTNVRVQFSGLCAEDAAFYRQLWARHLDRIATVFASANPRMVTESGTADVNADEQWLLDHGFGVEVEQEEADLFWTHLVPQDHPEGRAPNYGRGATADQSIERARRRYEVEELGGPTRD